MSSKELVWLRGEVKTPPFSKQARVKAGVLLRRLQLGERLIMPDSRSMPNVGKRCHELRIVDAVTSKAWRIIYRVDADAVIIGEVFAKKTQTTPKTAILNASRRFAKYDQVTGGGQ